MVQLWLAGKRIDTIMRLRALMGGLDGDSLDGACAELFEKALDGIAVRWLDRCHEARSPALSPWEAPDPGGNGLCKAKGILEACNGDPSRKEEIAEALAAISGAAKDVFLRVASRTGKRDTSCGQYMSEVESQQWYQADGQVRRAIAGIPGERRAVDSASLMKALSFAQDGSGGNVVDIFLLNVGKPFVVGNLNQLRNVRIAGYGNPVVRFAPYLRLKTFDLSAQNVKFERLRLDTQGVLLAGASGRCTGVEVG